MDQTPASNETKLGILDFEELNKYEAQGLKQTWDYLVNHIDDKFDSLFVNRAHKFGFGFLYDWAGNYRTTIPLVGSLEPPAPHLLTELMHNLFADLSYRLENSDLDNLESVVKLIAWFEYRFIYIHPYTNTNGRMGRLLANFILLKIGYPILNYSNRSMDRKAYIQAMREADNNDFKSLEIFIANELKEAIIKSNTH